MNLLLKIPDENLPVPTDTLREIALALSLLELVYSEDRRLLL